MADRPRLGIEGHLAWVRYATSGEKPEDVPSAPSTVYAKKWRGWRDWRDWLGTRSP